MKNDAALWNCYSNIYDILNQFYPYQEHLNLLRSLLDPKPGRLYLDAGCGTGNLTAKICDNGIKAIGIDFSNQMLAMARKKNEKIQFEFADLNKRLSFDDNFFDGVISSNVVSYLSNPKNTLGEIHRVLKPKGKFVVATLRVGFNPLIIYKEHLKYKGLLHTVKMVFQLLGLGMCNAMIVKKIRNGAYHTYDEETFSVLLKKCGFLNVKILFSYAGQDLIAVCEK